MNTNNEQLTINTVQPSVEILPDTMTPVERVGRMARLCYKFDAKEGEDTDAINKRIISRCIKEGHESILEHAVFSLYFPVEDVADSMRLAEKVTGAKSHRVILRQAWEINPTDAQRRYLFAFNDPEAMEQHCNEEGFAVPEKDRGVAPVVLGNARAFRLVIREKLFACVNMFDDPIALVITIKAAHALYKQCPVMFQDIVDEIKSFLSSTKGDEKSRYRVIRMVLAKLTDEERGDLDKFVARYFEQPDCIYAVPASRGASISMIITTDRATTHQHVRHRKDVAYSQESQRYVNYDKKGYCHMAFTIDPAKAKVNNINVDPVTGEVSKTEKAYEIYEAAMTQAFDNYRKLLELGVPPEAARKVLPNDCTTRLGVTWLLPGGFGNFLFWRTDKHAQFDIRRIATMAFIDGLETDHPYFSTFSPTIVKKFLEDIKEQKMIADERIDKLVQVQDARIALINKFNEEQAKEVERLQKEAEEEAKKAAEQHAVDPNELPPNAPRVIKVGEDTKTEVVPEQVVEPEPRIDRIPKEELTTKTENK